MECLKRCFSSALSQSNAVDGQSIKFANFLLGRLWPLCLFRSSAIDSLWPGCLCGWPPVHLRDGIRLHASSAVQGYIWILFGQMRWNQLYNHSRGMSCTVHGCVLDLFALGKGDDIHGRIYIHRHVHSHRHTLRLRTNTTVRFFIFYFVALQDLKDGNLCCVFIYFVSDGFDVCLTRLSIF